MGGQESLDSARLPPASFGNCHVADGIFLERSALVSPIQPATPGLKSETPGFHMIGTVTVVQRPMVNKNMDGSSQMVTAGCHAKVRKARGR